MANTITWSNLEHMLVATGPIFLREVVKTYFKQSPLLALLQEKGNVQKVSVSGPEIVQRLGYGSNSTVGWRSTRSEVPIVEQSGLTTASWKWGSLTGSVTFYDEDLHDNMGESQLVNLVQVTLDQLADTIKNKLAVAIGSGTSGDTLSAGEQVDAQILGLKDAIASGEGTGTTTPAHPPTYGGLTDADLGGTIQGAWSTQGAWSPVLVAGSGTPADVDDKLRQLVNRCTYGAVKPDFLLTSLAMYEAYEATMTGNIRYTNLNVGDTQFEGLAVRGIPLLYDPNITIIPSGSEPSGWYGSGETAGRSRCYAIRAADWRWYFDPQWDLQNGLEQTWRIPEDGFRRTRLLCIRTQLICLNRTTQGLLYNQATS